MDPLSKSFTGKCPECQSYNSRLRTELVNYGDNAAPVAGGLQPIASRVRIFLCNECKYIWTETVDGDRPVD